MRNKMRWTRSRGAARVIIGMAACVAVAIAFALAATMSTAAAQDVDDVETTELSVRIFSRGDPALAPEVLNYTFSGPCLAEPLSVAVSSVDTFVAEDGSANGDPIFASFTLPVLDVDGLPCTYLLDKPAIFSFDGAPNPYITPAAGFDFDFLYFEYQFFEAPGDFLEPENIRLGISTNAEEPPSTWNYDLSSPQPGCTNRAVTIDGLEGDVGLVNWVDDAGEWCEYTLVEVDLPSNLIQPPPRVFSFLQFFGGRQLAFEYLDPSERESINFRSLLVAATANLPETMTFELTTNQPGCTTTTIAVDDVGVENFFSFDDVATVDEFARWCRYELTSVDLADGWFGRAGGFSFAPPLLPGPFRPDQSSGPLVVSYFDSSAPTVVVTKHVDGNLDELPATWDFELTSEQAGCSTELLTIPSDTSASVRGAFVDIQLEDDDGGPCSYQVEEVNLPDGWLPVDPEGVWSLSELLGSVEFTNTDVASATTVIELFVNSSGDAELAPEYWEFEITSTCLAEPLVIEVLAAPTFAGDISFDSPQRRYIDVPRFDQGGDPCEFQIEQAPASAFGPRRNPQTVTEDSRPAGFVSFYNGPLRTADPGYPSQPSEDDPDYTSQPAAPTPTVVPVIVPTAAPVVAVGPARAPVVVAVAPTPVFSAAAYGFSDSLPTKHASATQLAHTGGEAGSATSAAAMLLLAGVFFLAVSKARTRVD